MGGGRSTISRRFGLYSQTIEDFTFKLNNSEELIEPGLKTHHYQLPHFSISTDSKAIELPKERSAMSIIPISNLP